ncbi:hypothetical protein CSA56_03055 [candidate division KSB3 bacterium]|uniref:Nucleotidyltransferase-Associated Rossmannoid Fold domain-containing protein n=1 Tax=candidate division KSB3 bacterium TaxID=2044937 RepID=A0A2G6KJ58_9BACT|nr:MAG: hypothetical protein CSA56_03055 [candidate division KSB3 bacterium]
MKKCIRRSLGFVVVFMFCGLLPAYAAEETFAELEFRIKQLEQQLILSKEFEKLSQEMRKERVKNFQQQYETEIHMLQNDVGKFKNEVRGENIVIIVIGALLAAFGVGSYFKTKNWAEKKIYERVEETIKTESEQLRRLVEQQKFETEIKENKRIALLSPTEEKMKEVEEYFDDMKFKGVYPRLFHDVFDVEQGRVKRGFRENSYDLIVFNQLGPEEIIAYIDQSKMDAFMVYWTDTENLDIDPRRKKKINLANAPFTLYARTMEILRFQAAVK